MNTSEFPYHITARGVHRSVFPVPSNDVWSVMEDYLFLCVHAFNLRVHSFVLMPNHFHLLITAPDGNISEAMNYFLRETSKEMGRLSGRINQCYGGRHHKTVVQSGHYFMNAYKYVYRNPVRAGLSKDVQSYRYSTLPGILGLQPLTIPIAEDTILFSDRFDPQALDWLNEAPDVSSEDEIRKALRNPEFRLAKKKKHPSVLETKLL